MIKIISFDLDGTLMDKTKFDDLLWFKEIPKIYAKKHGIGFEEAKKKVSEIYYQHDHTKANWYMPSFWFKHLDLKENPEEIMKELQKGCEIFPEVLDVLARLKKKYRLIILTHSTHEMNEFKLEVEGLKGYFDEIISTVTDLNLTKKSDKVYQMLLEKFNIKKEEIVHIGDNYEFDYDMPKNMGIKAFFLDRDIAEENIDRGNENKGTKDEEVRKDIVKDMLEFEKRLEKM